MHSPDLSSSGLSRKLPIEEHRIPSQISGLHDPAKFLIHVWRKWMTIVQSFFSHHKFALGIEHHEVGVEPRRNASFAHSATGELRGGCGHPVRYIEKCKSSITDLCPHQRECNREA